MYFTSKKGKWYSRAIHTKPLYRYCSTIIIVAILLIGWHYTIFSWIDNLIIQDQASLRALNTQLIQLSNAEKVCNELSCSLPAMQKQLASFGEKCCTPDYYQKQVDTVINESTNAGLSLTSYGGNKIIQRDWCKCNEAKFCFTGNLDNISRFFAALEKKGSMIRCTNFNCEKVDSGNYSSSCTLEFISLSSQSS